jgi:hypothetical protein
LGFFSIFSFFSISTFDDFDLVDPLFDLDDPLFDLEVDFDFIGDEWMDLEVDFDFIGDEWMEVEETRVDLDASIFCETLLFDILFIDARFGDLLLDSLFDACFLFFAANSIPIFPSIFTQRFVSGLSILPLGQSTICFILVVYILRLGPLIPACTIMGARLAKRVKFKPPPGLLKHLKTIYIIKPSPCDEAVIWT